MRRCVPRSWDVSGAVKPNLTRKLAAGRFHISEDTGLVAKMAGDVGVRRHEGVAFLRQGDLDRTHSTVSGQRRPGLPRVQLTRTVC